MQEEEEESGEEDGEGGVGQAEGDGEVAADDEEEDERVGLVFSQAGAEGVRVEGGGDADEGDAHLAVERQAEEGGGYPYAATTVQGTRADGCGEFTIAFEKKPVWDIYIYFAREDGTAYSPSRYLFVFYSIKKIWDNMLYSLFYE